MDTAADDDSPFVDGAQSLWNEVTDWRKNDRGVQFYWWQFIRVAHPDRSEFEGKLGRLFVTRPRESVDLTVLVACNLGNDVRRGAKAVDAKTFSIACLS